MSARALGVAEEANEAVKAIKDTEKVENDTEEVEKD